ncbi:pisatin demethylase [Xylogone sp. PMI_703]|nr:pisatin demethylase [Xylogone sp. PMI_703]
MSNLEIAIEHWKLILGASVLFLIASFALQTLRQYARLRHIKGPPGVGFSKLWMIRHVAGGTMHKDLGEVCEKYGSLARIGPNDLVTSDPELLRRMLGVRTRYQRSKWYVGMRFDPSRDNVLSERNDDRHTELRAKMAAGYSGKEVENLENAIDSCVESLIRLIDGKYLSTTKESKPFDFGRKAQYFTLDVISNVAYGEPFGFLTTDSDVHEYIKMTEENLPSIIMVTVLPWLNWLLQLPIIKSALPSETDKIGFGKIIGIAKKVVGERFGPDKKVQKDMLGSFINHGLTQREAESETLVQILAGSDTTATAIRATLLHLVTNPRVVSKLLDEIATAKPSRPIIKDAEARNMLYLQAVIKEGLRIFPPVTGLMSKLVPPGGDTYNGLFIPEGTKIGYCAWGVFHDKSIWGDDVNVYRPERWLEGTGEELHLRESTLELIFSYGRWQCLGKNVALIELNKVFVELLRNFDITLVDPTNPWNSRCHGIFTQSGMWLRASRREV